MQGELLHPAPDSDGRGQGESLLEVAGAVQ